MDRITNEDYRKRSVEHTTEKNQLGWYGHVKRMEPRRDLRRDQEKSN